MTQTDRFTCETKRQKQRGRNRKKKINKQNRNYLINTQKTKLAKLHTMDLCTGYWIQQNTLYSLLPKCNINISCEDADMFTLIGSNV